MLLLLLLVVVVVVVVVVVCTSDAFHSSEQVFCIDNDKEVGPTLPFLRFQELIRLHVCALSNVSARCAVFIPDCFGAWNVCSC